MEDLLTQTGRKQPSVQLDWLSSWARRVLYSRNYSRVQKCYQSACAVPQKWHSHRNPPGERKCCLGQPPLPGHPWVSSALAAQTCLFQWSTEDEFRVLLQGAWSRGWTESFKPSIYSSLNPQTRKTALKAGQNQTNPTLKTCRFPLSVWWEAWLCANAGK